MRVCVESPVRFLSLSELREEQRAVPSVVEADGWEDPTQRVLRYDMDVRRCRNLIRDAESLAPTAWSAAGLRGWLGGRFRQRWSEGRPVEPRVAGYDVAGGLPFADCDHFDRLHMAAERGVALAEPDAEHQRQRTYSSHTPQELASDYLDHDPEDVGETARWRQDEAQAPHLDVRLNAVHAKYARTLDSVRERFHSSRSRDDLRSDWLMCSDQLAGNDRLLEYEERVVFFDAPHRGRPAHVLAYIDRVRATLTRRFLTVTLDRVPEEFRPAFVNSAPPEELVTARSIERRALWLPSFEDEDAKARSAFPSDWDERDALPPDVEAKVRDLVDREYEQDPDNRLSWSQMTPEERRVRLGLGSMARERSSVYVARPRRAKPLRASLEASRGRTAFDRDLREELDQLSWLAVEEQPLQPAVKAARMAGARTLRRRGKFRLLDMPDPDMEPTAAMAAPEETAARLRSEVDLAERVVGSVWEAERVRLGIIDEADYQQGERYADALTL